MIVGPPPAIIKVEIVFDPELSGAVVTPGLEPLGVYPPFAD